MSSALATSRHQPAAARAMYHLFRDGLSPDAEFETGARRFEDEIGEAERGGKARRCVKVTRAGVTLLRESRQALDKMWRGLDPELTGNR